MLANLPGGVADGASVLLLYWLLKPPRRGSMLSFLDSAESSTQPRPTGGYSVEVEANNISVEHMTRVYRHPLQESGLFRQSVWLCFWLFSLCSSLLFGGLISRIAGFPWAGGWLPPAWAGGLFAILALVGLLLSGSLYSRWKHGVLVFWKDRCRESVRDIRKKSPEVVAWLKRQPREEDDLPWWWLFHPQKRIWRSRILAATWKAGLLILLAETAFWGWYGVGKDVLHRPYLDTLVILMVLVEIICIVGIYRLLTIEFSAWTGATNKAYLTFSQAVLRQDLDS